MRTEKTYRPVMSGQSIWDPGPTRHQTTPRRRSPSRAIPTTVRCHTVARSLYRPGGNQTNQPVNRYIHSRRPPKPTPHTHPLSDAPSRHPTPIPYQTRPQLSPYLSPIRHGPPIGPGHVRRSHTCTDTQSHAPPHTPAPHARPTHPRRAGHTARTAPATRTPHSTEQRARGSTEHRARSRAHEAAPSTEHGAGRTEQRSDRAAQSTEHATVTSSTESGAQNTERRDRRAATSSTERRDQRTERRGERIPRPIAPQHRYA